MLRNGVFLTSFVDLNTAGDTKGRRACIGRTGERRRGGCAVRLRRKLMIVSALAAGIVVAGAIPAFAQEEVLDPTVVLGTQVNLLWVVIGAVLVIFMQAGFALVETGFCRAKHAAHVVSTNFAIFGLGFVGFFLVGYALHVRRLHRRRSIGYDAPVGRHLIGSGNWVFLWQGGLAAPAGRPSTRRRRSGFFLYMVAFMDTTATIPTGAMAERWKWNAFVGWGLFCGAIYYPLFGAWTWGGGWLAKLGESAMSLGLGYVDFAGSGVVHAMGGVGRAGRCARARSPHRQVRQGRQAAGRCPATTSRWRCSARSSCCSAGSASTPRRPSRPPTSASRSSRSTPRIAGAFGAVVGDVLIMMCTRREARPRHDGQRHARRPRRHHGAVCLRAAVGGGGHRHHRRRHRRSSRAVHREARQSTTRSAPSRCTASAARSACSPSASSPTASTAPAGTAPPTTDRGRHRHPLRRRLAPASSLRRPSVCVVIWTVMFGIAFAFFKIQNTVMKGGIRPEPRTRARRARHPGDGRARLPRVQVTAELADEHRSRPGTAARPARSRRRIPVRASRVRSTAPVDGRTGRAVPVRSHADPGSTWPHGHQHRPPRHPRRPGRGQGWRPRSPSASACRPSSARSSPASSSGRRCSASSATATRSPSPRRARRDPAAARGRARDGPRRARRRSGAPRCSSRSSASSSPLVLGFGAMELPRRTTSTRRCSSAPRSRRRASASPLACSAISARSRPPRRASCSAPRWPTTSSGLVVLTVVVRIVTEGSVSVARRRRHRGRRRRLPRPRRRRRAAGRAAAVRPRRARLALDRDARRDRARPSPSPSPSSPTPPSSRRSSAPSSPASRSARSEQSERIRRELAPVGHLFIPVFFLQIGIDADIERVRSAPRCCATPRVLLVVAVVGKLLSPHRRDRRAGRQAAHRPRHAPPRRGRADLRHRSGCANGVLDDDLYAVAAARRARRRRWSRRSC